MLVGETDPQAHAELAALTTELQRLGWTEGQDVRIDYRWADGDVSRLQALATQLASGGAVSSGIHMLGGGDRTGWLGM